MHSVKVTNNKYSNFKGTLHPPPPHPRSGEYSSMSSSIKNHNILFSSTAKHIVAFFIQIKFQMYVIMCGVIAYHSIKSLLHQMASIPFVLKGTAYHAPDGGVVNKACATTTTILIRVWLKHWLTLYFVDAHVFIHLQILPLHRNIWSHNNDDDDNNNNMSSLKL